MNELSLLGFLHLLERTPHALPPPTSLITRLQPSKQASLLLYSLTSFI